MKRSSDQIVGVITFAILALVVFYPLMILFLNSFGITPKAFSPTFIHYNSAFNSHGFFKALKNTLELSLSVTFFALFIGGGFAWLLKRTQIPFKGLIRNLILGTFIIPSYIMAVSWIQLLENGGLFAGFPFKIYSLSGVCLVMTLHLYPMAFLAISNSLDKMDYSLEESAKIDGADGRKSFFYITLPLLMPTIRSIGLFIFSRTFACFGVAAILALPAREYILSTYIYQSMSALRIGTATAISTIMVALTAILFFIQLRASKRDPSAMASCPRRVVVKRPNRMAHVGFSLASLFLTLTFIFPLMSVVVTSLMKSQGMAFSFGNITLDNYKAILFETEMTGRAIRNSLFFGVSVATTAVFLALSSAYLQVRTKSVFGPLASFMNVLPMAIPEIIFGVAGILAWINPPLKLYNTPWILLVAYLAPSLPFAFKNIFGLLKNIPIDYEEMAMLQGASRPKAFWLITMPQLKGGVKSGWILIFLFVIREIPISSLLYSTGNETIGVLLFNLRSDTGGMEALSAVSVLILLFTFLGKGFVNMFSKGFTFKFRIKGLSGFLNKMLIR